MATDFKPGDVCYWLGRKVEFLYRHQDKPGMAAVIMFLEEGITKADRWRDAPIAELTLEP